VGRCPLFVFEGGFTQLIDRIRVIAERVARSYNVEIFDVQFRRESSGWMLRIFLDVPSSDDALPPPDASVSIQDCEHVSRDVSAILDVDETIDHRYILEVSSPGLDRPLRGVADYRRFAGRLAKLVVSEPVGGQTHFEGRLRGVEQDAVVIETSVRGSARGNRAQEPKRQLIPLSLITRARLEVEF
jgi:ribosome maturation factor RimP